ncbi:MAG TPA: 16S rRNA (adenine(1518)-N(6)/adenine(1519)-N(6))-dimethyltransferase RsmA [Candidatus Acidoferrales bacterium]|nr:16S rRNA (adenine(1518)-N(6)/adenine(1519)-N(6))-dimethyltransferase RsmA [Candidatus Acidoferrales bacterium]
MASVRRELHNLGIPPLKQFGQHFLLSEAARDKLIDEAQVSSQDTVVEVGAGLGFVTAALASRAASVIAIEKDRTLSDYLGKKFSTSRNVRIVQGDALTIPLPADSKIVSSPPYNISSKLVLRIISSRFRLASLLLQEDFVKRLTATNGSRDYGRLTVMLQTRARARYVSPVPGSAFYPHPKVDSAIATIHPTTADPPRQDERLFEELVRTMFNQRRRKAYRVLSRYLEANYGNQKERILTRTNLGEKRVYELTPVEFVKLSNLIVDSITG